MLSNLEIALENVEKVINEGRDDDDLLEQVKEAIEEAIKIYEE